MRQLSKTKRTQIDLLAERAKEGDAEALSRLNELDGVSAEHVEELVRRYGDHGKQTEEKLITLISGDNLLARQGLQQNVDALREELACQHPSPMQQLLVDRIVCCWLQVNDAQAWCSTAETKPTGAGSFKLEGYLQERLNHAHKRLLTAVKTLAQVSRLLGPNIQVNVAEKQVNVMGGS